MSSSDRPSKGDERDKSELLKDPKKRPTKLKDQTQNRACQAVPDSTEDEIVQAPKERKAARVVECRDPSPHVHPYPHRIAGHSAGTSGTGKPDTEYNRKQARIPTSKNPAPVKRADPPGSAKSLSPRKDPTHLDTLRRDPPPMYNPKQGHPLIIESKVSKSKSKSKPGRKDNEEVPRLGVTVEDLEAGITVTKPPQLPPKPVEVAESVFSRLSSRGTAPSSGGSDTGSVKSSKPARSFERPPSAASATNKSTQSSRARSPAATKSSTSGGSLTAGQGRDRPPAGASARPYSEARRSGSTAGSAKSLASDTSSLASLARALATNDTSERPHREPSETIKVSLESSKSWATNDDKALTAARARGAAIGRKPASAKSTSTSGSIPVGYDPEHARGGQRPPSTKSSVQTRHAVSESEVRPVDKRAASVDTSRSAKTEPTPSKTCYEDFLAITPHVSDSRALGPSPPPAKLAQRWRTLMLYPGQGGTFAFGQKYTVEDGSQVRIKKGNEVFNAVNKHNSPWKTKHLSYYGEDCKSIGTKECVTCVGVYFEIDGNRVFCAHINAYPTEDRSWEGQIEQQVQDDIKNNIQRRMTQHSKYYGWEPGMVKQPTLRFTCPFVENAGFVVVKAIVEWLKVKNYDYLSIAPDHGFAIEPPVMDKSTRAQAFGMKEGAYDPKKGMHRIAWDDADNFVEEVLYKTSTGVDCLGLEYDDNEQVGTWQYTFGMGWVTREPRDGPGSDLRTG